MESSKPKKSNQNFLVSGSQAKPVTPEKKVTLFILENALSDGVYSQILHWAIKQGEVAPSTHKSYQTLQKEINSRRGAGHQFMVVAPLLKKEDLISLDQFLNWRAAEKLELVLPVLALTTFQTPQLWAYLRAHAVLGYMSGLTQLKDMKLALNKNVKLLNVASKRVMPEHLAVFFLSSKTLPKFKLYWIHAFQGANDPWVIPLENFVNRSDRYWVLALLGPSPQAGEWIELRSEGDADYIWQWVPVEKLSQAQSPLLGATEKWYFYGKKPKFESGRWYFVGIAPHLFLKDGAFQLAEERHESRAKFKVIGPGEIEISPNSVQNILKISTPGAKFNGEQIDIGSANQALIQTSPLPKNKRVHDEVSVISKESNADKKNYFVTIHDHEVLVSMIKEFCSKKTPLKIWIQGAQVSAEGTLRMIDEYRLRVGLDFSSHEQSFALTSYLSNREWNTKIDGTDITHLPSLLGYLRTEQGLVFFVVKQFEMLPVTQRYVLELKQVLFQVQRRTAKRLQIPAGFPVSLQIDEQMATLKDISMAGLCAEIELSSIDVAQKFKVDKVVMGNLVWRGQLMTVHLRVRWIKKMTGKLEVGFSMYFGNGSSHHEENSTAVNDQTQVGLLLFEIQSSSG